MTGPEHYLEAERLLNEVGRESDRSRPLAGKHEFFWPPEQRHTMRTDAQIHATLALGAANGDSAALDRVAALMSGNEWDADTTDAVAAVVRSTGRHIGDVL